MNIWRPADLALGAGRLPERTTACGCLHRDGRVLLERRPDDAKVSPGVWDLPGGHLEPGETPEHALVRELREELGVIVARMRLGLVQDEDEAASRRLYRHYTYVVDAWQGEPRAAQGQTLAWFDSAALLAPEPQDRHVNPTALFALRHFLHHTWIARA